MWKDRWSVLKKWNRNKNNSNKKVSKLIKKAYNFNKKWWKLLSYLKTFLKFLKKRDRT